MENDLARLGIVGNLYKVYRAAIELGDVPVAKVIERTGLPKATVYDAIQRLQREGLVAEWDGSGKRRVVAHDPGVLLEQVETRKHMLTEMLPQLRAMYYRAKGKPNIRFYEGEEGVETALWDTLSNDATEMHAIFSMAELIEVPGLTHIEQYMKQRVEKKKFMKVIRSRSKDRASIWPSSNKELRELRYAPDDVTLSMTLLIYGSRVALLSSKKESYGMIIESDEFATLMREMYKGIWKQSEETSWAD